MLSFQPGSCASEVRVSLFEQALRRVFAVEQPHRLMKQTAERDQAFVGHVIDFALDVGAALHEREVDCRCLVAQQREVFRRPLGAAQFDANAVQLEERRVALAELGVSALVLAGGEDHAFRRRRIEHPVRGAEQNDGDEQERAGSEREVTHREQGVAQEFGHGAERWRCQPAR